MAVLATAGCVPAALSVAASVNDAGDDGFDDWDGSDDTDSSGDDADSGDASDGEGGVSVALSLGPDRPLTLAGGDGGGPKSAHCPAGAFVTRVDSWKDPANNHASGIAIYCAQPTLMQDASAYSVSLTQVMPAPYETLLGNSAQISRQDNCGLKGLVTIADTSGLADLYIEGLGNHCATGSVTLESDASLALTFDRDGDTSFTIFTEAGTRFNQACKSNEVVVGFTMRQGAWLNAIAPICAALQVVYM
ncbi:MAG TPA: hypothetical protein VMI75_31725 [Polyangiaceae bacterium]|nr:hypothetical protein [Polyangiaceae bacterium]